MSRICPQCEYDLTGLPEPCVCPECGTEIASGSYCIKVWPEAGRPNPILSPILIVVLGLFGLFLFSGVVAAAMVGGLFSAEFICSGAFAGGLGLVCAQYVVREILALRQLSRGTTTATLYCCRDYAKLEAFGSMEAAMWSKVTHIHARRSLLTKSWILVILGRRNIFYWRKRLIRAVLPYSRRTAAHVRNTLRRRHRAWQKSQVEARWV
jgi:hypothetical protein